MKIRFIKTLSTTRQVFRRKHDYDLEDAEAHYYIAAGVAEAIAPPPKIKKAEKTEKAAAEEAQEK